MPASLYRLAGKPHPTEANQPVAAPETVVEVQKILETTDVAQTESLPEVENNDEIAAQAEVSSVESTSTDESVESSDGEAAPVQYPTWDASWTKAQLLEVAVQLNLAVTSANTKTQIVEALTAATSS